jgi:hypothetical protein
MNSEDQYLLLGMVVLIGGLIILSILCCCGMIVLENIWTWTKRIFYIIVFGILSGCCTFTAYAFLGDLDMNSLHSFLLVRNYIYQWMNALSLGAIVNKLYMLFSKMIFSMGYHFFAHFVWGG